MDGVLVDSEPLWAQAEVELLARHGDQFTAADAEATHGRSIEETVAAYALRLGGVDAPSLRAELMALMRAPLRGRGAGSPGRPRARPIAPGPAAARRRIEHRWRPCAAGARASWARSTRSQRSSPGADVGRGKPHPDVYLAACRLLGVQPRDAVAFEDSPPGVQAAKAAGMTCVGIPERDGVDLANVGADLVVGSLADLLTPVGAEPR